MAFSSDSPLLANQLPVSLELPRDDKLFVEQTELLFKRISAAVNTKEGALYALQEVATFQQYFFSEATVSSTRNSFAYRPVYRMTIELGAIAAGGNETAAHNISNIADVTRVYGAVATATDFRPIPYASVTAVTAPIEVRITSTQYIVTNGSTAPAILRGSLVIEYTKIAA